MLLFAGFLIQINSCCNLQFFRFLENRLLVFNAEIHSVAHFLEFQYAIFNNCIVLLPLYLNLSLLFSFLLFLLFTCNFLLAHLTFQWWDNKKYFHSMFDTVFMFWSSNYLQILSKNYFFC